MSLNLSLTPGSLPGGTNYCFVDWQQTLIDFATNTTVALDLATASLLLVQDTVPAATQRGNAWLDTRVDRIYRWNSTIGAWLAKHQTSPNGDNRRLWVGTLVDLQTEDGGDSGTLGDASGPMWEEDTAFRGRLPVGVGTLSPSTTAVAVKGTGGVDQVTLTFDQVKAAQNHYHGTGDCPATEDDGGGIVKAWSGTKSYTMGRYGSGDSSCALSGATKSSGGYATSDPIRDDTIANTADPVSTMPPYYGTYVIKRTTRQYYKAT